MAAAWRSKLAATDAQNAQKKKHKNRQAAGVPDEEAGGSAGVAAAAAGEKGAGNAEGANAWGGNTMYGAYSVPQKNPDEMNPEELLQWHQYYQSVAADLYQRYAAAHAHAMHSKSHGHHAHAHAQHGQGQRLHAHAHAQHVHVQQHPQPVQAMTVVNQPVSPAPGLDLELDFALFDLAKDQEHHERQQHLLEYNDQLQFTEQGFIGTPPLDYQAESYIQSQMQHLGILHQG
jgi:hypothetical protein